MPFRGEAAGILDILLGSCGGRHSGALPADTLTSRCSEVRRPCGQCQVAQFVLLFCVIPELTDQTCQKPDSFDTLNNVLKYVMQAPTRQYADKDVPRDDNDDIVGIQEQYSIFKGNSPGTSSRATRRSASEGDCFSLTCPSNHQSVL
mmetsp:Transcript_53482/g.114372  ORF Transcript_53482/g.114372 Transcript_53482/m.114372 type:complete len:147 (-) Transcript_53482:117-557(-)